MGFSKGKWISEFQRHWFSEKYCVLNIPHPRKVWSTTTRRINEKCNLVDLIIRLLFLLSWFLFNSFQSQLSWSDVIHGSQLISFLFPYSQPQKVMFSTNALITSEWFRFPRAQFYVRLSMFALSAIIMLALQDLEGCYIQEAFMDSSILEELH